MISVENIKRNHEGVTHHSCAATPKIVFVQIVRKQSIHTYKFSYKSIHVLENIHQLVYPTSLVSILYQGVS